MHQAAFLPACTAVLLMAVTAHARPQTAAAPQALAVGWFDRPPNNSSAAAHTNFNTAVLTDYTNTSAAVQWLSELQHSSPHVKGILRLPAFNNITAVSDFVSALSQQQQREQQHEQPVQQQQQQQQQQLSGWLYVADEDSAGVDPRPVYAAIKAADPLKRNVTVVVSTSSSPLKGAADVLMLQIKYCSGEDRQSAVASEIAAAADAASTMGMAFGLVGEVATLSESQFTDARSSNDELCSVDEERFAGYAATSAGATAILFWRYSLTNMTWEAKILKPLFGELEFLSPAIAAGTLPYNLSASVPESMLSLRSYQLASLDYVIVSVFNSSQPANVTIHTGEMAATCVVRTLFSVPQVTYPVNNGQFTDSFEAYGVNIYRVGV